MYEGKLAFHPVPCRCDHNLFHPESSTVLSLRKKSVLYLKKWQSIGESAENLKRFFKDKDL